EENLLRILRVPAEYRYLLAHADVPQHDSPVVIAGEQPLAVRRERHRVYGADVALEELHLLAGGRLPHAHRVVLALHVGVLLGVDATASAGGDILTIARKRHAPDDVAGTLEAAYLAPGHLSQRPSNNFSNLLLVKGPLSVQ